MTQEQGWGGVLHQRIAGVIRNVREGRMSAQELADETARLGYPISRSQIANYESGRKQSLDVADLLVLAAALDCPPGLLLFPGYPSRDVEFLPGRTADAKVAVEWFSGERRLPTEAGPEGELRGIIPNDGTQLVSLVREFGRTAAKFYDLKDEMTAVVKLPGNDPANDRRELLASALETQVRDLQARLADLQEQINKLSAMFDVTEEPR